MKKLNNTTLAALIKGDHIQQFPAYGPPEENYDSSVAKRIHTYEIRSIDSETGMYGLVMAGTSVAGYAMPGEIGRVFIRKDELVTQMKWWA